MEKNGYFICFSFFFLLNFFKFFNAVQYKHKERFVLIIRSRIIKIVRFVS